MNDFLKEAVSLSLVGQCVAAVVGILFIHATFRVLEQTLPRRFGRADARYKVRKFVVYCGYLAILLFLAILFEDRLGRLSFALGIAGAGVAVALQDVLASIAGAFSIGFSKLYTVGDRVQIGDTRGDVIDIGLCFLGSQIFRIPLLKLVAKMKKRRVGGPFFARLYANPQA